MLSKFPYIQLPGGRRMRGIAPDATVEEVLEYADQSEAQADYALEQELSKPKPRKGVIQALDDE